MEKGCVNFQTLLGWRVMALVIASVHFINVCLFSNQSVFVSGFQWILRGRGEVSL